MGSRRSTRSLREGSRSPLSCWTCRCPTCLGWRSWSGSGRSIPGRRSCCPAGTGMTRPAKRIACPKLPRSSPNRTPPICWRAPPGPQRAGGGGGGEAPPYPGQGILGKGAGKPDDQLLSDIPHAVEDPVEAQDLLHGFIHVVGDPEEREVLGRSEEHTSELQSH